MNEEDRPNPDELLKAIQREEQGSTRGRLKIFLGMAAGVGKTYTMLEAAQKLKQTGRHVVVGIVNTHGRQDTARLVEGLTVVPSKWIKYKDVLFEELDLDEVLRLRPDVVLVDELAHSNVPGSRHPKRWQDVVELLDNGISVYTTLNVQHVESLKDVIENITGITIRETVPDVIIETAASIELIDITPEELLQRLKEGKVYLGDQSAIAARHFFQEDRLTALREIVMRYAAEKVDHDLHSMVSTIERTAGWKPREKLLVAVGPSPHSQRLIRTTRRLAFNLNAPWIAVHVNDGSALSEAENATLSKHLALARDLGAEVVTTNDADIARGIQRVARQKGVTQIVVGRPPMRTFMDFFRRGDSLLNRLATECSDIDVHVMRQTYPSQKPFRFNIVLFDFPQQVASYVFVLMFVAALTIINWYALPIAGYRAVGFVFLLGILFLSLVFRKGPVIFASLLYTVIWDLFFIPPVGSLAIASHEDQALLALYLLTAVITGILTDRARASKQMVSKREETINALYEIVREIAAASSAEELLHAVKERMEIILDGKCDIIVKQEDGTLSIDFSHVLVTNEKEKAAAHWVMINAKEAGWSTSTLPAVKNLYVPLKGFTDIVGVLAFRPKKPKPLTIEERNLLHTIAQQLATHLERAFVTERKRKEEQAGQIEKIYQFILGLVAKQFHNPLLSIKNDISKLKDDGAISGKKGIWQIHKIEKTSQQMSRVVANVSAMAKLSAGNITLKKEEHTIEKLFEEVRRKTQQDVIKHHLRMQLQNGLPSIYFDLPLMELLLENLICNAVTYSPEGSTIDVEAKMVEDNIVISVSDNGPGVPQELIDVIFEKFYRPPQTPSEGMGLGLSVAKAIAEAHGGHLLCQNRKAGGTTFTLVLSLEE